MQVPHSTSLLWRLAIGLALCAGLAALAFLALWWRLGSGPIQLDALTPWLAAAIEENFDNRYHAEVGGTQIERTEGGSIAVRVRDIVVRHGDGTVVASAPKAEVRIAAASLWTGRVRAESLNLVGAEMAVRLDQDGSVTIFAGADKHPIATAQGLAVAPAAGRDRADGAAPQSLPPPAAPTAGAPPGRAADAFAALLSWIDGIGEVGLDGHDLREVGLKNGSLTVDDARNGKRWTFRDISLSAARLHGGGVEFTVGSDNKEHKWALTSSITPSRDGNRKVDLEARRVAVSDLVLASRVDAGHLQTDLTISASVNGEIGADGVPRSLSGRLVIDKGSIGDADDRGARIDLDRAEFKFEWDPTAHRMSVPFQIVSGGNRLTLLGQVDAPSEASGVWSFKVGGGTVVLAAPGGGGEPLVLNRITVAGRYDVTKRRVVIDEGDIGNANLGVATSGNLDLSGAEPRLTAGLAGTRMPVDSLKRLWPSFISTEVRDWFNDHLTAGTVERVVIAVNSPLNALRNGGPPVSDDGLTLEVLGSNCIIRPLDGLPALRDADLLVRIVGRDATVAMAKGTADLASGRKLVVTSGSFEVVDTAIHDPPAKVRFKLEGPVPGAIELLRMDALHDVSDLPLDPAAVRGNMNAQVSLGLQIAAKPTPGSNTYNIAIEASNFAADHLIMGQKVEAGLLRVNATQQGFQLKGDVRIGGTPATLEYRRMRGEPDAEVRIQASLDETARGNLGFESGGAISGSVPIRLNGRVATNAEREGRFAIEADLTPVQIEGLLPGWSKPAGRPARAMFTLATKPQSMRIEDLVIDGAGVSVKGGVEFDGSGELQAANFSAYGFSDGDRASLKVDRNPDGALRAIMRGEIYDGRGFVKSASVGIGGSKAAKRPPDIDLDIKLGAVVGFNGEALRSVDFKMSRRAGEVRSFGLNAKIGRDATLTGDLRSRAAGHQAIYLESGDAGAFFRFNDIYSRMTGGQMTVVMDPPAAGNPPQQGVLNVRNFAVHDESQLERAVSSGQQVHRNAIDFSGMRVEFTRSVGQVALREGVVRGPLLGGTIDGLVNYTEDDVHLRGTLVPLYGPNNLLGQLPLLGLFLGGEKEGLVGITYEVVGKPGNPTLRINPISALAPGILRKVFEFPAAGSVGATEVDR